MIEDRGRRIVFPHHQDELGQYIDLVAGVRQEEQ